MNMFTAEECQFILFTPRSFRLPHPLTQRDLHHRMRVHYCIPDWTVLVRNLFKVPLPASGIALVYVPTRNHWIYRLTVSAKGPVTVSTLRPGDIPFSADTTWLYETD